MPQWPLTVFSSSFIVVDEMKHTRNRSEMTWLKLFGVVSFLVAAIFLVGPHILNLSTREPLADPLSLQKLMRGESLSMPPDEPRGEYEGYNIATIPPTNYTLSSGVLGVTSSEKRIEVDLTNQKVYAFEGNTKVYDFTVSTGKWAPTPTGSFKIWVKVRSQKMEGGNRAIGTYYYLPNVPYVMFFYNDVTAKSRGFSLHGAYWHNNFGHPMSHGCVNMRIEDSKTLYEWATPVVTNPKAWSTLATAENPGTTVTIYGNTPKE